MATMKFNSRLTSGDHQKSLQSGKLADAIYRNNTTFRKQLETELQKLETDTIKAQRNLELTQIAFRNKIRNQKEKWLKQQEKSFTKMYHYVYAKKNADEEEQQRLSARKIFKQRNQLGKINHKPEFDDYDAFYDDDDEFCMDDYYNEEHKKPILVLMNNSIKSAKLQAKEQLQESENNNSKLRTEKTLLKLSNNENLYLKGTPNTVNVSSKPTSYSQLNSRLKDNNSSLKALSNNSLASVKTSNEQPIVISDSISFKSNSINNPSISKIPQKVSNNTTSSLSFQPSLTKKLSVSRLEGHNKLPIDFDNESKNFVSSSPSLNKFPGFSKEAVRYSNNNSINNFYTNSNKSFSVNFENIINSTVRSFESIEQKSIKCPPAVSVNKTQLKKANEVQFRLSSSLINKQKFEERLKPYLKASSELQKMEVVQQGEQQVLKSNVLNDERFTNLISTLGTA